MPLDFPNRDVRLPAHTWNEDIAVDICESQIGCPAGTYKVQLLSDTELLLRKRPTSSPEMNWQDANMIIRLISGLFLWCGVPVSLAAGHRSKKEAKYDLDATFTYRHTRAEERTMLSKFRKDSKKSVICPKEPQPRGQGMIRRADKFFAKRMAGGWNRNGPPSVPLQEVRKGIIRRRKPWILTMTPRRKHKRWSPMWSRCSNPIILTIVPSGQTVPLSIVNAAQQKIGTGRESNADLRLCIPTELRTPRKGSKAELQMERSPKWCCPCSEIPRKKGHWSIPTGEPKWKSTSRRVTRITKSRTQCCFPWRERHARISGIVMNMVTCHLLRSLNGWTCPIMPPWTSGTSMPAVWSEAGCL